MYLFQLHSLPPSLLSGAAEGSDLSEASSGSGSKWIVSVDCTLPVTYLINYLRKWRVMLQNSLGAKNPLY